MGDEREERRGDLKPALAEVKAALGEQGRILEHLTGKIDKVVDLVTETGKWQAGHQAMTGEHEKILNHLGCQAGNFVERLTATEKRLERHAVKIAVLWAVVGTIGIALAAVGVKIFAGHFAKDAALMITGGTTMAAVGWQKATPPLKGLVEFERTH